MSLIRSKNTGPEKIVRKILRSLRVPFKGNYKLLPGSPDFYLPDFNVVIFVNGCFWHGHSGCRYFVIPKSNVAFWENKIKGNVARDQRIVKLLSKKNLKICIIWECEIREGSFFEKLLSNF